jgi:uncharacterized membrane protein YsdA (DUF1294 family)
LDKKRAKSHKWRIPEGRLLLFSLIGGSFGGILAMNIVKHKTNHLKFKIGMPLLLIINIFTFYYLMTIIK